ncbi:MAG: hypothetical protein ACRDZ7_13560 [Acidimicrobiia bacterium]
MRWRRTVGRAMAAALAILCSSVALASCGDDGYRRPRAEPGKVVTVLDAETPGVPPNARLTDIAVGKDNVLFVAFQVKGPAPGDPYTGLLLAVPAEGEPFVVADETEETFPEPTHFLPEALTVDTSTSTLYLADPSSQRIRAIDADGGRRNVTEFSDGRIEGPPFTYLQRPLHLTIDSDSGALYLADECQVAQIKGDEIAVIFGADGSPCSPDRNDDEQATGGELSDTGVLAIEAVTSQIAGLAFDRKTGLLHLTDNRGLFRIEADGTLRRLAGEGTAPFPEGTVRHALEVDLEFSGGGPYDGGGIATDSAGTLYLGAPHDDLVVKLPTNRAVIEEVARFVEPRRLVVSAEGELFVALTPLVRSKPEPVVRVVALPGG